MAKSFTKDAEAQASANPRISLLVASERDPTSVTLPVFNAVLFTVLGTQTTFYRRGGEHSQFGDIDPDAVVTKLSGNAINLREFINKWAEQGASEDVRSFRPDQVAEGDHEITAKIQRDFAPAELIVDGRDIERIEASVRYKVTVVRPKIVSYFEVESRGRVAFLAPIQIPSGPMMQLRFVSR